MDRAYMTSPILLWTAISEPFLFRNHDTITQDNPQIPPDKLCVCVCVCVREKGTVVQYTVCVMKKECSGTRNCLSQTHPKLCRYEQCVGRVLSLSCLWCHYYIKPISNPKMGKEAERCWS